MEPDGDIRRLLVQILSASGYSVVDRLEMVLGPQAGQRVVDVALVDLASGAQRADIEAVRARYPCAQFVLMAAAFGADMLRQGDAIGATVTLQKPLNEATVLGAVARALANQPR